MVIWFSAEISTQVQVLAAGELGLAGVTGTPATFTEEMVRAMAERHRRPVIFPLSNPTSQIEANPVDLAAWTDGRVLMGTGSPFDPVEHGDRTISDVGLQHREKLDIEVFLDVLAERPEMPLRDQDPDRRQAPLVSAEAWASPHEASGLHDQVRQLLADRVGSAELFDVSPSLLALFVPSAHGRSPQ